MKKGLLDHIDGVKTPDDESVESVELWKVNDLNAFAIVASSISPNLQSMVRGASTAAQVWEILIKKILRNSVHNRVEKCRKLHEFKMKKDTDLM